MSILPNTVTMLFAVNWVYKVLGKTSFYPMDDADACGDDRVKWLKDDEHAIVLGKTKPPQDEKVIKDCSLKLAPNEENKNRYLQLRFDSFYINDCDVELEIQQAPSSSPEDAKELLSLNCRSYNPPVMYAEENHGIILQLKREEKFKIDYNFRINVTSTEGPTESGLSSSLTIGLAVGGGIVFLLLLLILLKYLCSRRSKNEDSTTADNQNQAASVVYNGGAVIIEADKPPLVGYDARTGPLTPEHRALLPNSSPGVEDMSHLSNGGVGVGPAPPNDTSDAEVLILTSPPSDENTSVQDSAYNSNEENLPDREHSFRAARGNSPPPSYEDAVGSSVPMRDHVPDSARYANVQETLNTNRLTV